jgi:hypothetical protein
MTVSKKRLIAAEKMGAFTVVSIRVGIIRGRNSGRNFVLGATSVEAPMCDATPNLYGASTHTILRISSRNPITVTNLFLATT